MLIKTQEAITTEENNYFPDDILEIKYNAEEYAMFPTTVTGRFDSIRYKMMGGESILYLDISRKYRKEIIDIPIDRIKEIRKVEEEEVHKMDAAEYILTGGYNE